MVGPRDKEVIILIEMLPVDFKFPSRNDEMLLEQIRELIQTMENVVASQKLRWLVYARVVCAGSSQTLTHKNKAGSILQR